MSRADLTKSIHALKGNWRISQSPSTNFIVVTQDYFKQDNACIFASEIVEPEVKQLLRNTLDLIVYDTQNPAKLQPSPGNANEFIKEAA